MKHFAMQLINNIATTIHSINSDNTYYGFCFYNRADRMYCLHSINGYSIIYDFSNDRMVVAYNLKIHTELGTMIVLGEWTQGYYFDNEADNDLSIRYELENVVNLFLEKITK